MYNLPSGSYDDIFIRCIDFGNEIDKNDDKCEKLTGRVKCTCNNLVPGTEYKIKFITRKQNFSDEKFEIPTTQYTGNILLICY